jgi:hypothetical protein
LRIRKSSERLLQCLIVTYYLLVLESVNVHNNHITLSGYEAVGPSKGDAEPERDGSVV